MIAIAPLDMEFRSDGEWIEPNFTAVGALHRGLQAPLRFLMSVSLLHLSLQAFIHILLISS